MPGTVLSPAEPKLGPPAPEGRDIPREEAEVQRVNPLTHGPTAGKWGSLGRSGSVPMH